MRVRTVYFKVQQLGAARAWWEKFLGVQPVKNFERWSEFRVGEINLGLLQIDGAAGASGAPCVPVLEFADGDIARRIERAKGLGARVVLEGKDHPDYPRIAAVLVDPFGNEFEVTNLHD